MYTRELEKKIVLLLSQFPCVCILGARQVGKSTLLRSLLPQAAYYDLEREKDFRRIEADCELFLAQQEGAVIIDEAQLYPPIFSGLRVKIDENRKKNGQFLISGSSSPDLLTNISETLAGRIATVHLGPFTLTEQYQKFPSNLYNALLEANSALFKELSLKFSLNEIYQSCLRGGYPDIVIKQDPIFSSIWFDNYIQTYVYRDIAKFFPKLTSPLFKKFIYTLAQCSAKTLNYSNIARSLDVSQPTIKSYSDIAEASFLIRMLLPYEKNMQKKIQKNPKVIFRDTGLLCFLRNILTKEQLLADPDFGFIWESLIMEQVIRGLECCLSPFQYSYYRTYNDAEIDLIIEGPNGVIPIEIKSGLSTKKAQIKALSDFVKTHHCPFGIVINADNQVIKLSDSIYQIPAMCL
jgi:predicted AAA+ superfamily ATPase